MGIFEYLISVNTLIAMVVLPLLCPIVLYIGIIKIEEGSDYKLTASEYMISVLPFVNTFAAEKRYKGSCFMGIAQLLCVGSLAFHVINLLQPMLNESDYFINPFVGLSIFLVCTVIYYIACALVLNTIFADTGEYLGLKRICYTLIPPLGMFMVGFSLPKLLEYTPDNTNTFQWEE